MSNLAVTVVVLSHRRMRNSTNTYLTALAISDLLYLIFVFTLSLEHYPNIHSKNFYYYWVFYPFGVWFTDATSNVKLLSYLHGDYIIKVIFYKTVNIPACVSTWLTVTFTVERYIAVCHPTNGKIMCTESRARIAIILVYLLCFLSTVSTYFNKPTNRKITSK